MGKGISGAIPVVFHFDEGRNYKKNFIEHSPAGILEDFYDEVNVDGKQYYSIKSEILLPNFKDFYFGFHEIIEEQDVLKNSKSFNDKYDAILRNNDREAFLEHFSANEFYEPYYFTSFDCFSTAIVF